MSCDFMERETTTGRYLAGKMSEEERVSFELHYFDCDDCFSSLQALQIVEEALAKPPHPLELARPVGRRSLQSSAYARSIGWAVAAVALVAIGIAVLLTTRPIPSAPTVQLKSPPVASAPTPARPVEIAKIGPPPYLASRLRGAEPDRAAFESAMTHYQRGDYRTAAASLQKLPGAEARFFLGACYLELGDSRSASGAFRQVFQTPETPYLEEAHFYLAAAYLLQGDRGAARKEWEIVVSLRGDLERRARALLAAK